MASVVAAKLPLAVSNRIENDPVIGVFLHLLVLDLVLSQAVHCPLGWTKYPKSQIALLHQVPRLFTM
jgi:hypothetical protein